VTYLADSDIVADYLKGRPNAVGLIDRLLPDGVSISIIAYGEIYEGIYYGRDPRRAEADFRRFLTGLDILLITPPIARRFATIRGQLRANGLLIPQPDLLIAATALHRNLTLVTRNRQHFQRVPGLMIL
jgi:predicted nucleic acid-binding protein